MSNDNRTSSGGVEWAVSDSGSAAGDSHNVGAVDAGGQSLASGNRRGGCVRDADGKVAVGIGVSNSDLRVESAGAGGGVEAGSNTGRHSAARCQAVFNVGRGNHSLASRESAVGNNVDDNSEVVGTAVKEELDSSTAQKDGAAEGRAVKRLSERVNGGGIVGSSGASSSVAIVSDRASSAVAETTLGECSGEAGEGGGGDNLADGRHFD